MHSKHDKHTHAIIMAAQTGITASALSDALFKTEGARASLIAALEAAIAAGGSGGASDSEASHFLEAFTGLQRTMARITVKSAVFRLTQTQTVPGWRAAAANFAGVDGARVEAMLAQLAAEDRGEAPPGPPGRPPLSAMLERTLGRERLKILRKVGAVVDKAEWAALLKAGAMDASHLWAFFNAASDAMATFMANPAHALVVGRCRAQAEREDTPSTLVTYFMAFVDVCNDMEAELDKGNAEVVAAVAPTA